MVRLALIAQSLFTALFLAALLFGLPFAWILRDGLGPGSVGSSGWEAVKRCLSTYYLGPVMVISALLAVGARWLGKQR